MNKNPFRCILAENIPIFLTKCQAFWQLERMKSATGLSWGQIIANFDISAPRVYPPDEILSRLLVDLQKLATF